MTSQEKKQYLLKYQYLTQEVDRLSDERAQVLARAQKITPTLSDMPKSQSGANRLELAVEDIVENTDKLAEKIREMLHAKEEIEQVIDSLEDDTLREIMKYRYINMMTWNKVCYTLYHDKDDFIDKFDSYLRKLYRKHGNALESLSLNVTM